MKIHKPIGSKERFLEMFQGVNKLQINELSTNVMQTGTQLIEKAFEELRNKVASIKQTNTHTIGDDNFIEIITNDNEGNQITFTFKVNSTEADQDGVYNVDNAALTKFNVTSENFNVDWDENMKFVQEFNANHGSEIMDVVSEFANFETDAPNVDDEVYEDAIKLIDKVPYEKGTETIQTNKAYGDEKPTNPDLRVHATELDKFVSEMEDYVANVDAEDEFTLPDEQDNTDLPNDDGSIGVDPYDQPNADNDWEISGKRLEKPKKSPSYMDKTGDRERAIPNWAENFMENKDVVNMDADNLVKQDYNNLLSPEMKEAFIRKAVAYFVKVLGIEEHILKSNEYVGAIKDKAIEFYQLGSANVNEDAEKNDYPDQIGKKFKTKKPDALKKKRKKPSSVVKLSEEPEIPQEYWEKPEDGVDETDTVDVEVGNELEGGLGDNKDMSNFCPKQLAMGLEVEMEHTDDPKVALEIVMDHLTELPDYYTHLDKMEKNAGVDEPENQNSDDLETDELLGYKPHNVNDYASEEYDYASAEREYHDKEEYDDEVNKDGIEEPVVNEEDGFDEYTGDLGDRYQDGEGNQFTVRDKVKGGVTLQGQGGTKEIATRDIGFLKKLGEEKVIEKEIINEEEIKIAKLVLNDRNFSTEMTKKEAVQILIKHNIR